jgi:hypothetical protein
MAQRNNQMEDHSTEILSTLREIRDLIQLMAEPAIATRDQTLRDELRKIVGNSKPKAKAASLMNGSRTQTDIHRESGMQQSNLSTLVKQMAERKLILGAGKKPRLAITIPANFFEKGASDG